MIPKKSNYISTTGTPISSKTVLWAGECLECISVNTGDSISDVTFKLATEICVIKEQLDLSDLDLLCLFEACALCPDPDKSLKNILTLLINKVCTLEAAIGGEVVSPGTGDNTDPVVVASCFQTLDLNGDTVTSLSVVDYLRAIGIKVCSIFSTVTSHTSTLSNHESRIVVLENAPDSEILPTIIPSCVLSGGTARSLEEVLEAVELQFCQLRAATGTASELVSSTSQQCTSLNTLPALSTAGNMASISGWKSTVTTLADSINNLWLTICDIRSAVNDVQACCAKTCADITVNFLANITDNGATLDLYFSGYTIIPDGFENCDVLGSQLTITDGLGGSYVTNVNLVTESVNPNPLSIDITATPLNPSGSYSLSLASCLTDNIITCNKTIIVNVTGTALSCAAPSVTSVVLS